MLKINSLQPGEKLSITQYLTVESVDKSSDSITVVDHTGQKIIFRGKELIENNMFSAAQYDKTIKAGKHQLAEIIHRAGDKVFTVSFEKQDGTERILTGHYYNAEPNLGRTQVIDLNVPHDDKTRGLRLIDNRTISWVVLDGVRYIAQ